jgi:hypothetical protein
VGYEGDSLLRANWNRAKRLMRSATVNN